MGAIFYLVMDMIIHYGVWRYLREDVGARAWVVIGALVLDAIVLVTFLAIKWQQDALIVYVSAGFMAAVFAFERVYLRQAADD